MTVELRGSLLALISAILWGSFGIFSTYLTQAGFSAAGVASNGAFLSAVLQWAVIGAIAPRFLKPTRSILQFTAIYGLLAVSFLNAAYLTAIELTSVSTAVVLICIAPLWVMLYRLFRGFPLHPIEWIVLPIACCGVALVASGYGDFGMNSLGIFLGLIAGIAFAGMSILGDVAAQKEIHPMTLMPWSTAFGAIGLAFWHPPLWSWPSGDLTTQLALLFAWIILANLLPWTLFLLSLRDIPPQQASLIVLAEPIAAILMAVLILGEAITLLQIVGVCLTIGSVLLIVFRRNFELIA